MIVRNLFIEQMDKLISLLSAKNIRIVPGTQACTDGEGTIYMPWLPNNATEEDFIKFFCIACHEQAHFYGHTRVTLMSRDKVVHSFENIFDDIRCEYLQEQEYPGLVFYRIKFYKISLDEFANEVFINATTERIGEFIEALIKYLFIKNRIDQLNTLELIPTPSDELKEAYNKYVADLEPRIMKMKTDQDAFRLGHVLYERIIDLIKKIEEEKSAPTKDKKDDGDGTDGDDGTDDSDGTDGDDGTDDSDGADDSEAGRSDGDSDKRRGGDDSPSEELSEDGSEESGESDVPERSAEDSDDGTESESGDPSNGDVPKDGGETTEGDDRSSIVESGDSSDDDSDDEEKETVLKEAIRKALEEVADGEPMDFTSRIIEKINADALNSDQYMVDPNVKDDIDFNRVGLKHEADTIKNLGLQILGMCGSRMIKLFIDQSKPSYLHYQKSGRFDGRAFLSDAMDRRMNVYSVKMIPRLDKAAVSFMMDNSSSMKGVIRRSYAILSGLTYHLSRGNVPVEAVGFTADYCRNPDFRDVPVQLRIIKSFNEPYSGEVARRFVIPSVLNQNAEVDCMRFMIPRLMARPEQKKIFFVIGDGLPCIGNGKINEKLAKAYKEYINLCRAVGIIVFGFGINCNLSRIFGEDFISVDRKDMGDQILKKLSEVLNRPKQLRRRVA